MTEFEKIYDFQNLYKAHKAARLGKRDLREVIDFELNLAKNLTQISDSLRNKTYRMSGYYSFYVHDPKERKITCFTSLTASFEIRPNKSFLRAKKFMIAIVVK